MKKYNKWIVLIVLCVAIVIFAPITLSKYTSMSNDSLILSIRKPVYYIDYYHEDTFIDTQTFTYGTAQNLLSNSIIIPQYRFIEWNTKRNGTGISYLENELVQNLSNVDGDRITLYAIFSRSTILVRFDSNGGTGTMQAQTINIENPTPLSLNQFEYTGKIFSCWNTKLDGTGIEYTDGEEVQDISEENGEITLYAQWVDGVARIGNTYYQTLQSAINAVPSDNTETSVELLANVSENLTVNANKNINFDFKNHTITINTGCLIDNKGTINISNGNLISNSTTDGAINNQSSGKIVISGGRIIMNNSGGKQALYNNGGTVEITGNAYLRSESKPGTATNVRATVQNTSNGKLTVTGGTIISSNFQAINNGATLTIGTLDGDPNKNSLVIQGGTEGINSSQNFKFYDGIIKGKTNAVNNESRITEKEEGYQILHKNEIINEQNYKTIYLAITNIVTFNGNGGTSFESTRDIDGVMAIGPLPRATRVGYEFDGWFTEASGGEQITENTIISSDITFFAHWTKVMIAEINGVKYNSLAAALNTVPTNNTLTTIKLIHDTSEAVTVKQNQNIILDIDEYTLSNSTKNSIIENNGTVEVISGTILSDGVGASAVNNNATGRFKISGGSIIATEEKQAIYNKSGGYVEITGSAYLSSVTTGHPSENGIILDRATVQNLNGGTMLITGGTIVGKIQYAVASEGTLTVGIKEDGIINTSSPSLTGGIYGLISVGTLNLYDGIMKGKTGAISGTITDQEPNTEIVNGNEIIDGETYITGYLEQQ